MSGLNYVRSLTEPLGLRANTQSKLMDGDISSHGKTLCDNWLCVLEKQHQQRFETELADVPEAEVSDETRP